MRFKDLTVQENPATNKDIDKEVENEFPKSKDTRSPRECDIGPGDATV
jgi:hypothetical protein